MLFAARFPGSTLYRASCYVMVRHPSSNRAKKEELHFPFTCKIRQSDNSQSRFAFADANSMKIV